MPWPGIDHAMARHRSYHGQASIVPWIGRESLIAHSCMMYLCTPFLLFSTSCLPADNTKNHSAHIGLMTAPVCCSRNRQQQTTAAVGCCFAHWWRRSWAQQCFILKALNRRFGFSILKISAQFFRFFSIQSHPTDFLTSPCPFPWTQHTNSASCMIVLRLLVLFQHTAMIRRSACSGFSATQTLRSARQTANLGFGAVPLLWALGIGFRLLLSTIPLVTRPLYLAGMGDIWPTTEHLARGMLGIDRQKKPPRSRGTGQSFSSSGLKKP